MKNYTWDHLNASQLARYAGYYAKMELTRYGLDIYTAEADKLGIDFSAKTSSSRYYDFQVKSVRNFNYIDFPKDKFELRDNLIAAIVIFIELKEPNLFFIPSVSWETPNEILISKDNESKSEWGINLKAENYNLLDSYLPEKIISRLK